MLRDRALRLAPEDIGLLRSSDRHTVFGVVLETAHPDAVATLVALIDGSVSLYVTNGNGCVGCGSHAEVRQFARELLDLAERAVPLSERTEAVAPPQQGMVRIYLLTHDGLRFAEAPLEAINRVDRHLGALYFAGQRLLTAVERTGAGNSLAREIELASLALGRDFTDDRRDRASGGPPCLSVGNAVRRLRI